MGYHYLRYDLWLGRLWRQWLGRKRRYGATASAYTDSAIQRGFDTQAIIGKLDGITNGLCDGFYAQNTAVMNGFHGVDNAICNLGYQTQQGFNTTNVTLMQAQNALQSQLANCCCETREAIQGVNYNMAQNTCALQNMNSNTRETLSTASRQEQGQSLITCVRKRFLPYRQKIMT